MKRNTRPLHPKTLRITLRRAEAQILDTYGKPAGPGLRIPRSVARREIDRLRSQISAFERLSADGIAWCQVGPEPGQPGNARP